MTSWTDTKRMALILFILFQQYTAFFQAAIGATKSSTRPSYFPSLLTTALQLQKSEPISEEDNPNSRLYSSVYSPAVAASTNHNQGDDLDELHRTMRLGVLFLNLGGPEKTEDVEGFLYNLFADPDIIRLPSFLSALQKPLAYFIAKRRAPKSSEAYRSIGGGSPIVNYTTAQAHLVENLLRERGFENARCYFAMRYWHPFTEEVLQQMQRDRVNTLVIVPLYPQFSISTSGSSLRLLQDIFYKQPQLWGPEKVAHTVVPAWYHRPGYVKVMAKLILDEVAQYTPQQMAEGVHVLFSAHGVPQSYIEAGDPYQRQIEECTALIGKEVRRQLANEATRPKNLHSQIALDLAGPSVPQKKTDLVSRATTMLSDSSKDYLPAKEVEFHLSFQSRVGPVKWLTPYTEEKLRELGEEKGVKNLVVVPVSFVSEHIETLEEIDMEYRELAEESGIEHWRRVPALNTEPGFIEDMADLIVEALEAPTLTVSEAASKSYTDMLFHPLEEREEVGLVREEQDEETVGRRYAEQEGEGDSSFKAFGMWGVAAKQQVEARKNSRLKGRFAVLGLFGTTLLELLSTASHPILHMVGFK